MSKPWVNKSIYPLWYYSRKPNSDQFWILQRMALIPGKYKQRIADRYERIYRDKKGSNRKRANTFLNKVAKWCYKNDRASPNEEAIFTPRK